MIGLMLLAHMTEGAQSLHATSGEAVAFAGHTHLLGQRETGVGGIEQSVFFGAVNGHVVIAAHASVDEFDHDLLADLIQVAIAPSLERKS